MKKTFKLTTICLLFISLFLFQNCSKDQEAVAPIQNNDPVVQSSLLMHSNKALFGKINGMYNAANINITTGKALFGKKDFQLNNSIVHTTQSGKRVISIPVTKHFGKTSGLAGHGFLAIDESKGIENATYISISYPKNANKNLEDNSKFTGTIRFYRLVNKKMVSASGFVFNKGKMTSIFKGKDQANPSLRTEGWWDDFTETLSDGWTGLSDWWKESGEDCLKDPKVVGNALSFAGAAVGCTTAVSATIASGGAGVPLAAVACLAGMGGAEIKFLEALDNAGCF